MKDPLNKILAILAFLGGFAVWAFGASRSVVTDAQLDKAKNELKFYVDDKHGDVQRSVDEIKIDMKESKQMIWELWSGKRKGRK